MRRGARSLLAFGLGLCVAASTIGRALPEPEIDEVSEKLDFLRQHGGEFDTIFFGSSRIYHQIMPRLFDELTAEAGVPTHSFNAAIDGMRPPELNYYVERVRAGGVGRLRRLCVETGVLSSSMNEDRRETLRGVYWHDLPRMWMLWRAALSRRTPPKHFRVITTVASFGEPWSDFSPHLGLFFRQFTHLGGAEGLTHLLLAPGERPVQLKPYQLGPARDGYLITGRPETMSPPERADYEKRLAERKTGGTAITDGGPLSQEAYEGLLRPFEAAGATSVLIIPPTTGYRKFHLLAEKERGRRVLDFSDVERYPELYAPEYRLDSDHLNARGAEIFTRLFAREFCAALRDTP